MSDEQQGQEPTCQPVRVWINGTQVVSDAPQAPHQPAHQPQQREAHPVKIWLNGVEVVPDTPQARDQAEAEGEDPGAAQVRAETLQMQEALRRGMDGRYRTPQERQAIQQALDALYKRQEYRRVTGKDFIPDWLCAPVPKDAERPLGPRW
jgi:hypothetical protein